MSETTEIFKEFITEQFSNISPQNFRNEIEIMKETWEQEYNNKEKIEKHISKIQNKQVSGFEKFKSWSILEHLMLRNGVDCVFTMDMSSRIEKSSKTEGLDKDEIGGLIAGGLIPRLTYFYNECGKVFNLNMDLRKLLENTNSNRCFEGHLPFPLIFIDLNELELGFGISLYGILLLKVKVKGFKTQKGDICEKDCVSIFAVGRDNKDGESIWFEDFISDEGLSASYTKEKFSHMEKEDFDVCMKVLSNITINFLNLINHQEVELVNKSMKLLRDARVKKGRLGIPDSVEINLTGKLKRYISNTAEQNEKAWELGYRFWVRGHWMEFRSDRYKNMQGKKVWVLPYIKGKGELVKKDYYIGEKEQCWENEKRMIEIITSLYPNEKIEKHNRTVLDGLEIDCYIPSLKLGFEYNGLQHYEHVKIFNKTVKDFEAQKERDIEKRRRAEKKQIKIITIRYDEEVTEETIQNKLKEVNYNG